MQKICIIGDGLSGLTAAAILGNENIKVDLYSSKEKKIKTKKDVRTTAISESNYKYLINNLKFKSSKFFWSSREVNLFYENKNKITNFLNLKEKNVNLMYIFKNNDFTKEINKIISKNKKIKILKKSVNKINFNEGSIMIGNISVLYNMIILCAGANSVLYKIIDRNRSIKKNYEEMAITTTIHHNSKIRNARQYFLKEGPLAILPFSKKSFSVVWSVNNSTYNKNYKKIKIFLQKKNRDCCK